MNTMATMVMMMIATTPRGWRLALTKFSRARRKPTSTSRGRELLRGRRADPTMVNGGSLHRAALAPTPLLCPRWVGPFLGPNLLPHLGRATGLRLRRRGH